MPFSKNYLKIGMRLRFMPGAPPIYSTGSKGWKQCWDNFSAFKPSDTTKDLISSKCLLPENKKLILNSTIPYGFGNSKAYLKMKSSFSPYDTNNDIIFDNIHRSIRFENLMDLTNAFTLASREITNCPYITGEITLRDVRIK